jgi:hypothetical protein
LLRAIPKDFVPKFQAAMEFLDDDDSSEPVFDFSEPTISPLVDYNTNSPVSTKQIFESRMERLRDVLRKK